MKWILILGMVVLTIGCAAKQPTTQADPCKDFDLDVQKIWNVSVKAKIEISMQEIGGEVGASKAEQVITKMDNLTRDWIMLKESACRDHFKRQLITVEEYKQKANCFDAYLQQQRTLINSIEGGDSVAVNSLLDADGVPEQCK